MKCFERNVHAMTGMLSPSDVIGESRYRLDSDTLTDVRSRGGFHMLMAGRCWFLPGARHNVIPPET